MLQRDMVSRRHPEAQAVEEPLTRPPASRTDRGRWFIYAGPDLDARVLGRGTTEAMAWANAAHILENARRRVRLVVAGPSEPGPMVAMTARLPSRLT
jgi:hypothetical protein